MEARLLLLLELSKSIFLPKVERDRLIPLLIKETQFLDRIYKDIKVDQRLWHIKNEIMDITRCASCGDPAKWSKGKGKYVACSSACSHKKSVASVLKKYGINNISMTDRYNKKRVEYYSKKLSDKYSLVSYVAAGTDPGRRMSLIEHLTCGYRFVISRSTASMRIARGEEVCLKCNPKGKGISRQEKEVLDFIKSIYTDTIVSGDREEIKPYELDIWIPSVKKAIEFNGDYHHANPLFYGPKKEISIRHMLAEEIWKRDADKATTCHAKGISLLTIWENEWKKNRMEKEREIARFLLL